MRNLGSLGHAMFATILVLAGCVVGDGLPEDDDLIIAAGSTAIPASADTWVRSGSSVNSNKGTDVVLSADSLDSGGAERRIYVQFNVPANVALSSVHLELYCVRASDRGGELRTSTNAWTETGLTWNNQPALGTIIATQGAVTSGAWVTFDVTNVITTPGWVSFALTTPSSQEVRYESREGSHAPRLVLGGQTSTTTDGGTTTTPTPTPTSTDDYLLIKRATLMALSTTSSAYARLKSYADSTWPAPSLDDQDRKHGTFVLAAAMIYARTGATSYRDKARAGIMAVIGTENDATTRTLSVGRQLGSYVLAADFIRLDGTDATTFKAWVSDLRTRPLAGNSRWYSLKVTHEDSSNNWGAWAGASLIAASLYLHDTADITRRVQVVKGFLGDRSAWSLFRGEGSKNGAISDDERTWSCDPSPSGYIPTNGPCVHSGINLDGAFPADAMRGGPLTWPVPSTGVMYENETMQGMLIQAELLYQAGYDVWSYQQNALRRAGDFLARTNGWNYGSISTGNAWLANRRLGTSYPQVAPSNSRMLVGYDWLWGP